MSFAVYASLLIVLGEEKIDTKQSPYKEIYYEEDNMLCRQEAENVVTCFYVVDEK